MKVLILLIVTCLVISGCGSDGEIETTPVAKLLSTDPPSGSRITAHTWITLTFDNPPVDLVVSHGAAAISGKTVTVSGPFDRGRLNLTVTWADGTQTLTYLNPFCCATPPRISGGTIEDGDTDVDPDAINSAGKIELLFSEDVTGYISLQTKVALQGVLKRIDLGWHGRFEENRGILELVEGREIDYATTYIIAAKVADDRGNEAGFEITFTTIAKE